MHFLPVDGRTETIAYRWNKETPERSRDGRWQSVLLTSPLPGYHPTEVWHTQALGFVRHHHVLVMRHSPFFFLNISPCPFSVAGDH